MKLSKSWKALGEILRKTLKSLKDISNFSMLLLLFMYIFALLGMQLFANICLIDGDDNLVVGEEAVQELYASGEFYTFPRDNFNGVGWALTSIFIVIIGEDWNWAMYQWVRAYGHDSSVSYHIAVMFFVLLMILGNIVLFSLFTAILLQNFEGGDEDEDEEEEGEVDVDLVGEAKEKVALSTKWEGIKREFKEAFGKRKRKDLEEEKDEEMEKVRKMEIEMRAKPKADLLDDESVNSSMASNMSRAQIDEEERKRK